MNSSSPNDTTDEDLMRQYQLGDLQAFEMLYVRHKTSLYHYLLKQLNYAHVTAEDLFQEIWLNLIRAQQRYEVKASFKTYLYRIAHNRLIDHYRQQSNLPASYADFEMDELEDSRPLSLPEDQAQLTAAIDRFSIELDKLPEAQRETIMLKQSGFSLSEMADVTGVNTETVKSRLRYAINKLRHALKDVEEDRKS